jgi:hypothetical protein
MLLALTFSSYRTFKENSFTLPYFYSTLMVDLIMAMNLRKERKDAEDNFRKILNGIRKQNKVLFEYEGRFFFVDFCCQQSLRRRLRIATFAKFIK